LNQILNATRKITVRFDPINNIEDFTNTPEGMEKLDTICMQLIAIGESLKNIDSEVVYDVCENKISPLSKTINKIIGDLKHSSCS